MNETNLSKMIETALNNLKSISDVDTIIGKPLSVSGGVTIIPISKMSMGFVSGGVDFISKNNPDKGQNFGGTTGSGLTLAPIAFLIVDADGGIRLINVDNPTGAGDDKVLGTISALVDKAPSLIEKIMKIFKKDKTGEENTDELQSSATVFNNEDVEEMK